jgi:hypothetical protein
MNLIRKNLGNRLIHGFEHFLSLAAGRALIRGFSFNGIAAD